MNLESEKRAVILTSARKLFGKKGFDHTTIDDIVQMARCGKGTFYRYFKNKAELLDGLIDSHFEALRDALEKAFRKEMSVRENFQNGISAYIKVFRENADLTNVLEEQKVCFADKFQQKLDRFLKPLGDKRKKWLQSEIKAKNLRKIDVEVLFSCFSGTLQFLLFQELKLGKKITKHDISELLEILLCGILL